MSLLSQYYKRQYMIKTLSAREQLQQDEQNYNIENEVNRVRSLLSNINETYESAAQGYFATSGELFVH